MDWLIDVSWRATFIPDVAILEIVLRGTIVYLALYFLLRTVLKRQSGSMGITDLLVIVLIADAAQNAMADEYRSVPAGVILVATILFWSFALDWLGHHVPRMEKVIYPQTLPLVKDGRMLRRNMQQEMITEAELMSQIRLHGADDLTKVKEANLERDGRVSVIFHSGKSQGAPEKPLV